MWKTGQNYNFKDKGRRDFEYTSHLDHKALKVPNINYYFSDDKTVSTNIYYNRRICDIGRWYSFGCSIFGEKNSK